MIDLDNKTIEFQCPQCSFYNAIFLKQVRLRDVIICRGCKSNIQLDDQMNEYRKTKRAIRKVMQKLEGTLQDLNIKINI